jgi:Ethylbenzene dehydrogenase
MKLSRWPVFFVTAAMLAGCGAAGSSGGAGTSAPNTMTAIKVDATSLDASAAFWANAPKTDVVTKAAKKGAADGPKVTLQAAYDGQNIVVRAEWADSTDSWQRNVWKYDGTAWKRGGEQDRLAFAFPMSNNAAFASKGCGAICHNQETDDTKWWMGTDTADTKIDLWQWQSAATNPVNQADDQWWGPKPVITSTTGRQNDKLDSGGSKTNATKDGKAPAFVSKNGLDVHYLLAGDEVAIDLSKIASGAIIPGSILSPFKGSRGDISAQGTYANGKWVVVISRALNTGHDDDAVLTPPKPMPFGLAVFDNSGDLNHVVAPDVLTLAWQ